MDTVPAIEESAHSIAQQPYRASSALTCAHRATSSAGGTDGVPPTQRVISSRL